MMCCFIAEALNVEWYLADGKSAGKFDKSLILHNPITNYLDTQH